jgi:hypothetical protein
MESEIDTTLGKIYYDEEEGFTIFLVKGDLYSTNRFKSQSKSLKNSSIFGDSCE